MPIGSRQIAHMLHDLSNMVFHHFLVSGHGLKFGTQLANQLAKCFIFLSLSLDKALHETLKIGFLLRRWIVRGLILKTRELIHIGWCRIDVSIRDIRMIAPPRAVCV